MPVALPLSSQAPCSAPPLSIRLRPNSAPWAVQPINAASAINNDGCCEDKARRCRRVLPQAGNYLALGKNNCSPLGLKSAIAFWPSGEVIQSMNFIAPS